MRVSNCSSEKTMCIRALMLFFIVVSVLPLGAVSAFSMRPPQHFSPTYAPVSPTGGFASFTPYYRTPSVAQPQQRRSAGRYGWDRGFVPERANKSSWPFPVSYRPVRMPITGYNHPMPYRPFSRAFYRPVASPVGYPWQQMPYRPAYAATSLPFQPERGVSMANQFRRSSPGQWQYPRDYRNFAPRPTQPAGRYGQTPARGYSQWGTVDNRRQLVANPYRFRPLQPTRRYVPRFYTPPRGRGLVNYPVARWGAYAQQWPQATPYGQGYRFRPDPRFSYQSLPVQAPQNYNSWRAREQTTVNGYSQADSYNRQRSVRGAQSTYPYGWGGSSRIASR